LERDWTKVFSIDSFVVKHFIGSDRQWVLELTEKRLRDPKKAHSKWFIQFGEAMSDIGKDTCNRAGGNIYRVITRDKRFRKCSKFRNLVKNSEHTEMQIAQNRLRLKTKPKIYINRMSFPKAYLEKMDLN